MHHRTVDTTVTIGYDLTDAHTLTTDGIKPEELNTHAARRASMHGIQHVRRQSTTSYRHAWQPSGIAVHHEADAAVRRSRVTIGHHFAAIVGPYNHVPKAVLGLETHGRELRKPREDALAHLHACGVESHTGIVDTFGRRGKARSVYFRDPDGSLLEFITYPDGDNDKAPVTPDWAKD